MFFSLIGDSGTEIESAYREAQTNQTKLLKSYTSLMKKTLGEYNINNGTNKAKSIEVEIQGKKFKTSRNQLMSLYLLWNRPDSRRHLETGGAAFVARNGATDSSAAIVITYRLSGQ